MGTVVWSITTHARRVTVTQPSVRQRCTTIASVELHPTTHSNASQITLLVRSEQKGFVLHFQTASTSRATQHWYKGRLVPIGQHCHPHASLRGCCNALMVLPLLFFCLEMSTTLPSTCISVRVLECLNGASLPAFLLGG